MIDNVDKTVLRIVQDYCFDNSAYLLSDKFALAITPQIVPLIESKTLELGKLRELAKKRRDYFVANENVDFTAFCKGLFKKLDYELSFYSDVSFCQSLLAFKRKMENGNFRGFPQDKTSEDTLRSALALYIQQETFCEPRSGAGNNDITVPAERVIIETKLWKGQEYYNSGFPELNDYLIKSKYDEGYYIIFDYNKTSNPVIQAQGEAFDERYEGKLIHVIFIRMNAISPSQIYKTNKKKKATT